MKVLDVLWFSSRTTVGIVATKNEMDEIKFYIGAALGFDSEVDTKNIVDYGAKFNPEILNLFIERNSKQ